MSLNFQIVSDLHVEFWTHKPKFNFIKPSAPILVLLGDTCCVGSDEDFSTFKRFINEYIDKFEHIIFISGNHEYYYNKPKKNIQPNKYNTMEWCDKKLKLFAKNNPKLHYLNNNTMTLNSGKKKYLIIGSVLWSWIPIAQRKKIQNRMNDYSYIYVQDKKTNIIRNITSDEIVSLHIKNRNYIKNQIKSAKKIGMDVIVFTHHKPYLKNNYKVDSYDCAYESDLTDLFEKNVILWCYGHTHIKDNVKIKNTRLISNPKGYPYQQTQYNKSFTLSTKK